MTVRLVERGDVHLNVHDEGDEGAPAVVLLHGFPDSSAFWVHQREALVAAGRRVITPDQRGFGGSSRPGEIEAYRITELVADVAAILDTCGLESTAIVGHDIGSVLAWSVAAALPQRVTRLAALTVGFPCGGFTDLDLAQWEHWWYMLMFQEPGVAETFLPKDDWRALRAMLIEHPDPDAVCRSFEPEGALTAGIAWYRANVPPGQWAKPRMPAMPLVKAPTWGVWTSGDPVLGREQMARSADYCAGEWRIVELDGVSHWFPGTDPEMTNRLLLDFLAD